MTAVYGSRSSRIFRNIDLFLVQIPLIERYCVLVCLKVGCASSSLVDLVKWVLGQYTFSSVGTDRSMSSSSLD